MFLRVANDNATEKDTKELVRQMSKKMSKRGLEDDQMNTEFAVASMFSLIFSNSRLIRFRALLHRVFLDIAYIVFVF